MTRGGLRAAAALGLGGVGKTREGGGRRGDGKAGEARREGVPLRRRDGIGKGNRTGATETV